MMNVSLNSTQQNRSLSNNRKQQASFGVKLSLSKEIKERVTTPSQARAILRIQNILAKKYPNSSIDIENGLFGHVFGVWNLLLGSARNQGKRDADGSGNVVRSISNICRNSMSMIKSDLHKDDYQKAQEILKAVPTTP